VDRKQKHTVKGRRFLIFPVKDLDRDCAGGLHLSVQEYDCGNSFHNLSLNNCGQLKARVEEEHIALQATTPEGVLDPPDEVPTINQ
jgi:hypothetical protein